MRCIARRPYCRSTPGAPSCSRGSIGLRGSFSGPLEDRSDTRTERPRSERLAEKLRRAELEDQHLAVLITLRGQDEYRQRGGFATRPEPAQHAVPIQLRQVEVQDDDVRRGAVDLVECLDAVGRLDHAEAAAGENVAQNP